MPRKELHEDNRRSWNAATIAHNSHKADQAAFFRDGGSTLFPEEIDLLGDLSGANLLHLQCNAGQDSLSLARLGAIVTGVDISDEAIAFAQQLSADSGIPATFVRADVYDWLEEAAAKPGRYDRVFCSYGVIPWLSDIQTWARGIAGVLKPGGRFVLIEFHPFTMVFDLDWTLKYPYIANGEPLSFEHGVGDYVAMAGDALTPSGFLTGEQNWINPHAGHEFPWGIGEVVTAILDAGLQLSSLTEYRYSNGAKLFDRMRETPGKRMIVPEDIPALPLMYSLTAIRPET